MNIKTIIITALVIGFFFTGQALASHGTSAPDDTTSYGFRDGAAEGQRGVQEQEARPDPEDAPDLAPPVSRDWQFGAATGQNGVLEQDSRAGGPMSEYVAQQDRDRETNANQAHAYFGSERRGGHDFPTIDDSLRPPDGP